MSSVVQCSLGEWQERLVANFDEVALRKLELPQEPVTFALEHRLSNTDIVGMRTALHNAVAKRKLSAKHYLCWAAYAAEIGYLFAGDEYWQTFEEQTPRWNHRNRPFIRTCLQKFSEQYHGAKPSGAWAQHRSIIGWPITHAILPRDLQRQLAAVLYRIRHRVESDDVSSPRQLGRLIATQSHHVTSRFRQISSEPELIGQIAAALLLDDQPSPLIEERTLRRITDDLNAEAQARSWLGDAKRQLSQRARVVGLRPDRGVRAPTSVIIDRPPAPQIRPKLGLHPHGDNRWRLLLHVPDLAPLLKHYTDLQPMIESAQVRVGSSERGVSIRALLHGGQSVVQPIWPNPGSSLLEFVPHDSEFDALLEETCALEPGPWLFRVGVDGTAREIRSRRVMVDANYIVVTAVGGMPGVELGRPVDLACDGVEAFALDVQSLDALTATLAKLGFQVSRALRVQPVGIVPAHWDDDGSAEWLSTDHPMISVSSNYSIARFDLRMNTGEDVLKVSSNPPENGQSVLLQLPQLRAGQYQLSITAHPRDPRFVVENGEMEVAIRDPSPDGEDARGRVALVVTQEPVDASYDGVFDESLRIQALGPTSRVLRATVRLRVKRSLDPLFEITWSKIPLPMTAPDWTRRVQHLVNDDHAFSTAYRAADSCDVTFDAGDLGVYSFVYDRPFAPLRWGVRDVGDRVAIQLYDDVDNTQPVEILRYAFSSPLTGTHVGQKELDKAAKGHGEPGLYLARADFFQTATIVPFRSFEALSTVRPRFRWRVRTKDHIAELLDGVDVWGSVSTAANLIGRYAWRKSLRAMIQQLAGLIAGTPWYKAELAFSRAPNLDLLIHWIPHKEYGATWGRSLVDSVSEIVNESTNARVLRFSRLTGEREEFCQFCLQMASDPSGVQEKYPVHWQSFLSEMERRPEMFRAARFMVLASQTAIASPQTSSRELYEGWQWK